MRLLLDSHVVIWFYEGAARLTAEARDALEQSENQLFVSVATHWELGLKHALGRLPLLEPLLQCFHQGLPLPGTETLPIDLRHVAVTIGLPPHHGDPFDRMLIAQAVAEEMTVVTHDRQLEAYGAPILWT